MRHPDYNCVSHGLPQTTCTTHDVRRHALLSLASYNIRQAAEAKLAEANRMIDESLLVATKSQQENKALQEDVSVWFGVRSACLSLAA